MGLITVADLTVRQINTTDSAQAQAAIEDASAVARACVEPTFDDLDADTATVPAVVVAVVVGMVRRVLTNPTGLTQETLGDYSYTTGGGVATLLPTTRERRLLRRAAAAYALAQGDDIPAYGTGGVYMQADFPADAGATIDVDL